MKWLSRNWPLAIAGGIIALMIIKKIISNVSLPPIEKISGIEGLLGGLDVIYIRLLAVGIIVAIYFGNKFIKGIGLVALTLIVLQSGIGDWGETVVKGTDKWFSCQAKPEQAKCLKEKKVVAQNYIPTQPQVIPPPKKVEPEYIVTEDAPACVGERFKIVTDCRQVTLTRTESQIKMYVREADAGWCVMAYNKDPLEHTIEGNIHQFIPKVGHKVVVAQIYTIRDGESAFGGRCGN